MIGPDFKYGYSNFSVTCWPGRSAASIATEILPGQWGLLVRLDPAELVIMPPPGRNGRRKFADWCRELSRESAKLATELDPDGDPEPPEADVPGIVVVRKDPRFDEGDGAW